MAEYKVGDKLICKNSTGRPIQMLDYKNSFEDLEYVTHPKTLTSICDVWDHEEYPNDFELYVETPAKPPLGLRPWNIADNERVVEILEAMLRYTKANKDIPEVWMEELVEKVSIEYE